MSLLDANSSRIIVQKLLVVLQQTKTNCLQNLKLWSMTMTDCYDTDRYGFLTIVSLENCINTIKDDNFNFWLIYYSELMPEVDILDK